MYEAIDYLAYLGYGAMRLFQEEIIWGAMVTFGPGKRNLPVPFCHKYCTVKRKYHHCLRKAAWVSLFYPYTWLEKLR